MKELIFVGWVRVRNSPVDGETAKNQYIIAELKKYCKVTVLDFYQKSRHPWIFIQALWALVSQPKATIIFSTSAKNVYGTLKLFRALHLKRDVIHWVVGGVFGKNVKEGKYSPNVFNYVKYNLVQCHGMITELESAGITNARFVSNFKPIYYYPNLEIALASRVKNKCIRFVFLSRIRPAKGCDYILESIQRLNESHLQHHFIVDFYGKIDASYESIFFEKIKQLENSSYRGQLDLRSNEGYNILATYHALLFPSYWVGEGVAGVFIDAFIAGLPVLASDWAHNTEVIKDGELGLIYPTHDVAALEEIMRKCITGQVNLMEMAKNARAEASKYQADHVITPNYLRSIGLI